MSTLVPPLWVAKQTDLREEFTSLTEKASPEFSEDHLKMMEMEKLKDA